MYLYSKTTNGFYSLDINTDIPDDALEITDEQWGYLLDGQSSGKVISSNENGYPILIDLPPPTHEEYVAAATAEKNRLMLAASAVIAPLQDAADYGIATPEDLTKLQEWKYYRILLSKVEVNDAPNINWPPIPN